MSSCNNIGRRIPLLNVPSQRSKYLRAEDILCIRGDRFKTRRIGRPAKNQKMAYAGVVQTAATTDIRIKK